MDAAVQMAPTHRFYKDGNKIDEYVGSSYPALEVRPMPSLVFCCPPDLAKKAC